MGESLGGREPWPWLWGWQRKDWGEPVDEETTEETTAKETKVEPGA